MEVKESEVMQDIYHQTNVAREEKRGKRTKLILLLLAVLCSILFFALVKKTANGRAGYLKKHQDEYTECTGSVKSLNMERLQSSDMYKYTYNLEFVYSGERYTRYGCTHLTKNPDMNDGMQVTFLIRSGSEGRNFSNKNDLIYGTMADNLKNSGRGNTLITIVMLVWLVALGVVTIKVIKS